MTVMEITTRIGCKPSCSYCPQEKLLSAYAKRSNVFQLSFDVFKTCIDKIPLDVDIIFAGFSEPMLNLECTKMVSYAHKRGHKVSMDTTLVGMTLSDIDLLESIPFKFFGVHLASAEGYEKIEVDNNYLKLLERISGSKIKVFYKFHGKTVHPIVKSLIKNRIDWAYTTSRARNIKRNGKIFTNRLRGVIGCKRELNWNVLLPNGDVVLCSSDYGLQHILGNLILTDYNSLFQTDEFLKVKNGLSDEASDILCRYCDRYTYNVNLPAKVFNFLSCTYMLFRNLSGAKELVNLSKKTLINMVSWKKEKGFS